MTHVLKHYRIQADGSLRLVREERVRDAPRARLDFSALAWRDATDRRRDAVDRLAFEELADAACEAAE